MEGQEEEGRIRLQLQFPSEVPAPQGKFMQDYLNPTRASTPSCIVLPMDANTFFSKSGMLLSLSTFHCMECKSPYLNVKELEKMVGKMVIDRSEKRYTV
ncbi:hypothetical protein Acr_01g0006740 [Actinidia rufa]|uniref:Uncharacterized protein n=1 Tax=Actinidia rufa TaxID=165716 RepID=A0A7J0E348_9ERIC|nr:hypothetical protein Acr_01g0006740 [Actinidia rufa]